MDLPYEVYDTYCMEKSKYALYSYNSMDVQNERQLLKGDCGSTQLLLR